MNLENAFQIDVPSLQERLKIFKEGELWKVFSLMRPSPFANFKKQDIMRELVAKGHDKDDKNKVELQEELSNTLGGIQRPPAMFSTP